MNRTALSTLPDPLYSIAAVERDTGLTKDTLRVWERRYGFPQPLRDANDERAYPSQQLEKLRLIRHLMDQGQRPGRLIGLDVQELASLIAGAGGRREVPPHVRDVMELITGHDAERLRAALVQLLMKQGLQHFITDTVAPLNEAIGDAWLRGEIAIFHEHLYSEQIQHILRNAIIDQPGRGSAPRVLLTSLPGERHRIGLLMTEAMLALEGASCVALGSETPVIDIRQAVDALSVDVVALSCSAAVPAAQVLAGLEELRGLLPESVALWAGGGAISHTRKTVPGVALMRSFDAMQQALAEWRRRHA